MKSALLTPDRMLDVIPGRVTCEGTVDIAHNLPVSFRGYHFDKAEVLIPCLRDYKLVRWKKGVGNLGFLKNGVWEKTSVSEGSITLLSRAEESRWYWLSDIEVSHIYISNSLVNKIANEVFGKEIDDVYIRHNPSVNDSLLSRIISLYEDECTNKRLASDLYLQTLEIQMCIHLIRNYAQCPLKESGGTSRLSGDKKKLLEEYIESNLSGPLSIQSLANLVAFSQSHFIRVFSSDYGCAPHAYVQSRRFQRAKKMLASSIDIPLKVVAFECGFSDQSHLTRFFKEKTSLTPRQYRQQYFTNIIRR